MTEHTTIPTPTLNSIAAQTIIDTTAPDDFSDLTGRFTLNTNYIRRDDTFTVTINDNPTILKLQLINGAIFTHSITTTYGELIYNAYTGAYKYIVNDEAINRLAADVNIAYTFKVKHSWTGDAAQTFTINVMGADDAPVFNDVPDNLEIAENEDGSDTAIDIVQVTATDIEGNTIRYRLSGAPEGFVIDETTGQIRYEGSGLDHETTPTIKLTVFATSNGMQAEQVVTIAVTDIDEAPSFDPAPSGLTIEENQDGSTTPITIGQVEATDPDEGDTVRYSLKSGAPANFEVDPVTGQIRYTGTGFDYEALTQAQRNISLTIIASSSGGQAEQEVTISVLNQAPVFSGIPSNLIIATIQENQAGSTTPILLGSPVTARDPENSRAAVTYSLQEAPAGFEIDSATGQIRYTGTGLDYEEDTSISLTVIANSGGRETEQTVIISVTNVNEAPDFDPIPNDLTIKENIGGSPTSSIDIGSPVTARDLEGAPVTYVLFKAPDGFTIDAATGQIRYTGAAFDYEALTPEQRSISLTIFAIDGTLVGTQTVTITVTDVDEAPTAFTLSSASGSAFVGTSARTKLADIDITDDALGTNTPRLTAGSTYFEIVREADGDYALYLKAGQTLAAAASHTARISLTATGTGTTPPPIEYSLNVASITGEGSVQLIEDSRRFNTAEGQIGLDNAPTSTTYSLSVQAGSSTATSIAADDTSITGTYGTLIVDQDGTWEYTVNNNDLDTNALNSGQTGTETFTFTYTDSAGQTLSHTLTVTIEGRTDYTIAGYRAFYQRSATADLVIHHSGNGTIYTGSGDDIIIRISDSRGYTFAGGGSDEVYGGKDRDRIYGQDGNDYLYGNDGHDYLYGDDDNDYLYGGDDNDHLYGGEGNDYLDGGIDQDQLYGGEGNDYLDGGRGADTLYGGANNDNLYGNNGSDTLYGEGGNDYLNGGKGRDILAGGAGNDIFVLGLTNTRASDLDIVIDFTSGDKIEVDTPSGAETTLEDLKSAANLRWTQDSNYGTRTSTNDPNTDDTVIYDTQGTDDTSDDIVLMVLEDYNTALTITDFDII